MGYTMGYKLRGQQPMSCVSYNRKTGKIQFRHPHGRNDTGSNAPIKRGVAKLTEEERGRLIDGLDKLLELKPELRNQVPSKLKICKEALDMYFEAMAQGSKRRERSMYWTRLTKFHANPPEVS
jgi:hypothetical protein